MPQLPQKRASGSNIAEQWAQAAIQRAYSPRAAPAKIAVAAW
jgi:hypothetical protein